MQFNFVSYILLQGKALVPKGKQAAAPIAGTSDERRITAPKGAANFNQISKNGHLFNSFVYEETKCHE